MIVFLVGCQKSAPQAPAPNCTEIMKHLSTVMSQGMKGHEGLFGAGAKDIAECEGRHLTDAQKRCLFATKTMADIAACKAGRAEPQIGSNTTK